jgi:hypothetical protein
MIKGDLLDWDGFLEIAQRELLLDGKTEFFLPIRRKAGCEDFYGRLELELRDNKLVTIIQYRSVKEGWAKVSRPSLLRMDRDSLIRERPHLSALQSEISKWRVEFVDLGVDSVIRQAYREAIQDPSLTRSCFEVFAYLLGHRSEIRGLLPRQVQHANSTKLIGRENLLLRIFSIWRSETASWNQFYRYFELLDRPVEFRFFAPRCLYRRAVLTDFNGLLSEDWASDYQFEGLTGTLIVENQETFYSEVTKRKDRLVLWGSGWKAALLRSFHQRLPRPIFYWGDIDKDGYEIYGHLKTFVPDLTPILMDHGTIAKHIQFSIPRDKYFGPYQSAADLQQEYQDVCQRGICIEQEKIRSQH